MLELQSQADEEQDEEEKSEWGLIKEEQGI